MACELRSNARNYPVRDFPSRTRWETYAHWLRRHALVSLCLLPEPPRTPLRPKVFGKWQGSGYVCEKVAFESMPGHYVTGNLFRPSAENHRGKRGPGILCPHGHWPDGRLHDFDPLCSIIARCVHFARMGATVFSYDMVGYNDSCQVEHAGDFAYPAWGLSHMALQTWNSIRAVDFLLTIPRVDPQRLGVTGASGGGTQSFALMAVDGRIAVGAPICMVSHSFQGGCICENAPLLRIDATNMELTRLFAPNPLFLGSCSTDWTSGTPKVELPAARDIWHLFGAKHRVSGHHTIAQHNYNKEMREAVYGFFHKWLFGAASDAPVPEDDTFVRPPLRDRMVWWGRSAPKPVAADDLRKLWIERQQTALRQFLRTARSTREGLGRLLPHVLGVTLDSVSQRTKKKPEYLSIVAQGDALLVAPRLTRVPGSDSVQFFTTYNRTLLCEYAHEILAALERSGRSMKLVGKRGAGVAALLAAAVSGRVTSVHADLAGFDPASDASWLRHCNTPAIRQIGGLAAVFACIGDRTLELHHAADTVHALARRYAREQ